MTLGAVDPIGTFKRKTSFASSQDFSDSSIGDVNRDLQFIPIRIANDEPMFSFAARNSSIDVAATDDAEVILRLQFDGTASSVRAVGCKSLLDPIRCFGR